MAACDGKVALVTGTSRGLARRSHSGSPRRVRPSRSPRAPWSPTRNIKAPFGRRSTRSKPPAAPRSRSRPTCPRPRTASGSSARWSNALAHPTFWSTTPLSRSCARSTSFPERRVRLMMEMHVLAPLHLTQLAIPAMRERGRGWVLNVTSVGGDLPDGPAVLRLRPHGRLRYLRHGQGGTQPADEKPCGRALRRRHRRQRRGAVQPGRHARRRHAGPGQDRHRGHRADHPDRVHAVHRRPEDADRTHRPHPAVPARDRLVELSDLGAVGRSAASARRNHNLCSANVQNWVPGGPLKHPTSYANRWFRQACPVPGVGLLRWHGITGKALQAVGDVHVHAVLAVDKVRYGRRNRHRTSVAVSR